MATEAETATQIELPHKERTVIYKPVTTIPSTIPQAEPEIEELVSTMPKLMRPPKAVSWTTTLPAPTQYLTLHQVLGAMRDAAPRPVCKFPVLNP
jgi:hypothetical protein